MTEYIIRHEQLEKFYDWIDALTIAAYGEEYEGLIGKRLALFEHMEVPPLVRCKDCELEMNGYCSHPDEWNDDLWFPVEPDGFCAWGERKVVD